MEDFALASTRNDEKVSQKLQVLLEAVRIAAQHALDAPLVGVPINPAVEVGEEEEAQ